MARQLIEIARRRPLAVGGGVLGVVVAIGVTAFALGGGAAGDPTTGPALGIAVVAPEEPDIQPGERMGVGRLVDDFDAAALAQASAVTPPEDFADDGVQSGWVGDDYPPVRPSYDDRTYADRPEPRGGGEWRTIERPGDRRGMGFDGPRLETGAEREARMGPPIERPSRPRPSGDPSAAFY